jgi:hypothetical protein
MAAATFLAAQPALHDYAVSGAVAVLVAAAVGSTVIGFGVPRWWRQPFPVSYALSLVGLVVLLLLACGPHPATIVSQAIHGPSRLLSETLPLAGNRSLLSPLIVLTWLAGATAAELMGRLAPSRPEGGAALIVPLVLFGLCYAAGTGVPGRDNAVGPLLLITLALVGVARRVEADSASEAPGSVVDEGDRPRWWRPAVVGAVAAGAATAVVAAVVPAVPALSSHPVAVQRPAPTAVSEVVDPLDIMANLRDGDPARSPQTVASVTTDQPSTGYLAMGVLNDYDGAIWSFNSTFKPTGGRVAAPLSAAADVELQSVVQQRIQIMAALPIPLLPGLDRPLEMSGLAVLDDGTTGMLVPSGASREPGLTYRVTSQTPRLVLGGLPPADGIDLAAGESDLALPAGSTSAMTAALRFLSTTTSERPAPTVAFLQAAAAALHAQDQRIDPTLVSSQSGATTATTAPEGKGALRTTTPTTTPPVTSFGGTSLSEVVNAVTVARKATPEQFATLFAMAARDLGVPARVVTGLRIGSSSAGAPVGPGTYDITNRQAWAWVEVPVSGVGWVVVDPTPDAATGTVTSPPDQAQAPATTLPPRQANAVPRGEAQAGHPLAKPSVVRVPRSHPTPIWVLALLALSGLMLVGLIAGPGQAALRRWLRRRARRTPDPGGLAVGAWLEVLDGLSQAGMETSVGATSSEVAAEAAIHFGVDLRGPVGEVGALADRALYSTTATIDHDEAERAWALERDVRVAVRSGLDRRQRARALLAVGSGPRRPAGPSTGRV